MKLVKLASSPKVLDIVIHHAKYNSKTPGSEHTGCREAAAESLYRMLKDAGMDTPVGLQGLVMPNVVEVGMAISSLVLDATPQLRKIGYECLLALQILHPSAAQTAEEAIHESAPGRIKHLKEQRA